MINLLIYALIVFVLYVIFGSNEHEGEVMNDLSWLEEDWKPKKVTYNGKEL